MLKRNVEAPPFLAIQLFPEISKEAAGKLHETQQNRALQTQN